jgi:hypothetical protein
VSTIRERAAKPINGNRWSAGKRDRRVLLLVGDALVREVEAILGPACHSWACVDSESGCVCKSAALRSALAAWKVTAG